MFSDLVFGLFFCGFFGILMSLAVLIQWSDSSWSDKFLYCTISLFLGVGFCLTLGKMNRVLTREPVVSSCISFDGVLYEMVDSTLCCKRGLAIRYRVIKFEPKLQPNDHSACENCGAILVEHYMQKD